MPNRAQLESTLTFLCQKAVIQLREAVRLHAESGLADASLIDSYLNLHRLADARGTAEQAQAMKLDMVTSSKLVTGQHCERATSCQTSMTLWISLESPVPAFIPFGTAGALS